MSKELVALYFPPVTVIGEPRKWPPDKGKDLVLDNTIALSNALLAGPQGPLTLTNFQWKGTLTFKPSHWGISGSPAPEEEQMYAAFRAKRSGLEIAGPGAATPDPLAGGPIPFPGARKPIVS